MLYMDFLVLSGEALWTRLLGFFFLLGGAINGVLSLLIGGVVLGLYRMKRLKKKGMSSVKSPLRRWSWDFFCF